jgi:hypothetical protein
MTALNNVVEEEGVTHIAAICAICKSQFSKVLPYYNMGMDMVVSVHQLVSNALILTGQDSGEDNESEDSEAPAEAVNE